MIRPLDRASLVALLAKRVLERPGFVRVAIDGPPAARPEELASSLAEELSPHRPVLHVQTRDFLRAASLRLELGRTNPDSYYEGWVDLAALNREVLTRADRVLPTLRNPVTDRATRASYVDLSPNGVVILSGDLLLGAGLHLDLTVHLEMSPAALARRTPEEQAWTLPAYTRYANEVGPSSFADVLVRMNDPNHPALMPPAT